MKTYLKTLVRVFKKHYARFLSVVLMVLISVGFISGVGGAVNKIDFSLDEFYKTQNVSDLILKSKSDNGFSDEEIDKVKALYGEEHVNVGMSVDVEVPVDGEKRLLRLYFYTGEETVNIKQTTDSEPTAEDFKGHTARAEQADNMIKELPLGTVITLDFESILTQLAEQGDKDAPDFSSVPSFLKSRFKVDVTVTETVLSPLTFALDGEPSYKNPEGTPVPETVNAVNELITLDGILYMSADVIPSIMNIQLLTNSGDMYIALPDREKFGAFSASYETYIQDEQARIKTALGEAEYETITLCDNFSFYSLSAYADKVMWITVILLVAFLFITVLVVQSNMSRLIEEERSQIACLRTLGYNAFKIIFKYVLFAMLATGIGGVGAYFLGVPLAGLIYWVFNYSFVMPRMGSSFKIWFYLVTFFVIVIGTLTSTVISGAGMMREKPANLLHPKAPRAGRKVILERIPIIWNRFSFKYKSTLRNVLRYTGRFVMTVVAVAGSMGLILAGLALLDMCLFGDFGSPSIMLLAVIIVVFAGLLTAVVIYTLTNINISERGREIATLMVLGYHDREVAGYIYREIYINTAVGLVFGYPVGLLLMWFVFTVIDFGSIAGVSWFVWFLAPFVTLLFTFIVTLILSRKIVRIDMNESLKAVE